MGLVPDFVGAVGTGFERDITLSMAGVVAFEFFRTKVLIWGRSYGAAEKCFEAESKETAAGCCEEETHVSSSFRNWGALVETEPPTFR